MSAVEEFRYLVLAAQREGNRVLADLLRPLGLSPSQAEVIRVLADEPDLSLQQLGQRLVCEAGSPSRLVDGLVRSGHLARTPDASDRRAVRLHLTELGQVAARDVARCEAGLYAQVEPVLDEQTLAVVNRALERVVEGTTAGRAITTRFRR